jgi:IS30 family transposase
MTTTRINFTQQEKAELWARWRQGASLSDIGRALKRHPGTIYTVLLSTGGYTPHERCRSPKHLSLIERENILQGLAAGHSFRAIAALFGRAPSTISRDGICQ